MILSNFAVTHRTTVLVLAALIVVAGWSAYSTLPRESAPDITFPFIMVMTPYEGASPSDIESLITYPIERKLKNLADVEEMRSTSSEGMSVITLEFVPDLDIDTALQKVRDKVDEAGPDLPDDLDPDPIVKEIAVSSMFPVMFVNISGTVGPARLKRIAEDIEEDIEGVHGVLDVDVLGDLEREIRVEFDQDRLAAYGLTIGEIIATITNNNVDTPGGHIDIGEGRFNIKAPAEFTSPEEIDHLVVAVREGRPVYLTDLSVVRDTFKDRESFSRIDRRESVTIKVTKRAGENMLEVAEAIKARLDVHRRRLPAAVSLTITSDASEEVEMMVADLENNILSGLVLVLVVIFISLGFRNAALVALTIPLSMLITFAVLQMLGMTLNMVVLFGLTLSLGMLVDNAIVIVENIYRHRVHDGKPLVCAALDGAKEVAWPVITSTMTTVAAFAPLTFWPGIMGEFMGYLPRTVIITLLASLFVALVITPTLGSMFIHESPRRRARRGDAHPDDRGALLAYRRLLGFGLRFRVLSVLFFFGLLVVAMLAFGFSGLGSEMFPDTEPKRIIVSLEAPEGTNIFQTDRFAAQAERIVSNYGNIEHITTTVGGDGANRAQINVDMVDRELRRADGDDGLIYFASSNDTQTAMRGELTHAMVGIEVKVDKMKEGPPVGAPINVEIGGDDYVTLARLAERLRHSVADVPGVVDLEDDYQAGLPELEFVIDKERAALLGLNAMLIGQVIKGAINGVKVGDYREAEDEYDITARLPADQRGTIQDVLRLRIPDATGHPVPLTSVAKMVKTSGLSSILHVDQKRVVTVSANVAKDFNAREALTQVRERAERIELPSGYTIAYTGENEEFEETSAFLIRALTIALFLIALVLVTQFDSVVTPLIIMTSVVLSLIGVFLGLILTHRPFGVIMTGMGVISLAGVVVNNAIVLIDYTNQLRTQGRSVHDAVIEAGCTRFRPVMLTAVTTVLGLLPMAIGVSFDFRAWSWSIGNESSQWWGPMATTVIFGLIVATTLTLFVVPNLYSLAFSKSKRGTRDAECGTRDGD